MPPKQKPSESDTPADRETTLEAKRLRARASTSLLQPHSSPHTAQIPTSLRKSDGADIIKRNANRKRKYLFIFPGALSLPATGGRIGSLTSLDTRNPILNIQFPLGTLRLFGTLVFPQNAFISVKPAKRAVQVMDVFETMIVFSEWRWVGDPSSNPGGVPVPLPNELKGPQEDLWRSGAISLRTSGEGSDTMQVSSDGESPGLVDTDEEGWAAATSARVAPLRSNPRRKGRVVNYSQLEKEESKDDSREASDGVINTDTVTRVKRPTLRTGQQDTEESLEIVEDMEIEEVKPRQASRCKRRKVDYLVESGDEPENDRYMDSHRRERAEQRRSGNNTGIQDGARTLQLDDSVQLVETVKADEREIKTRRRLRRTPRKIKYSQESGDENVVDDEDDDDDEDFNVNAGDGSDVLTVD